MRSWLKAYLVCGLYSMPYVVVTFYHFFDFPECEQKQAGLKSEMLNLGIKGSLLIASEGINGTLSGTRENIDAYLLYLKINITKGEFEHKESMCERQPFGLAKVRRKKETISFGAPIKSKPGIHVEARDWNALINDPDVVLLDTRNDYEVHVGTFKGAINPKIRNFKELRGFVHEALKPAEHKKIATFCTGGIRCEKFSAWLLDQGFAEVYQLKGGILKYLEEIPEAQSQWQGECYVFDDRMALGHRLAPSSIITRCKACGHSLTVDDRKNISYPNYTCCPHCSSSKDSSITSTP
jgi:UPF0176 protein